MIIIKNKVIPFGGYKAINLFGFLFTKIDLTEEYKNHENIHTAQLIECAIALALFILILTVLFSVSIWWLLISPLAFYAWYGIEYLLIRILNIKDKQTNCYHDISFEEEAYNNDDNLDYLDNRKPFSWIKYLNIKKYEVNS